MMINKFNNTLLFAREMYFEKRKKLTKHKAFMIKVLNANKL